MFKPVRIAVMVGALALLTACGSDPDGGAAGAQPVAPAASDASAADASASDTSAGDALPAVVQQNSQLTVEGAALISLEDPSDDPAIGAPTPVIAGQSFDGTSVTIGGPTDGPTLLVFLAHWCPHCNDEIPELNDLRDSAALPADLNVIGISTAVFDDRPNYPPSSWMVDKDWTWPVLADSVESAAFLQFGGSGFPYLVLVDVGGNVLARTAGTSSAAQIDAWIDAALAQA